MKAQITLETLLILSVAISMLLISSLAVNRLQFAQTSMYSQTILKNKLWEISNVADEICVLGEGNSRSISLPFSGFDFYKTDDHTLFMNYSNLHSASNTLCNIKIRKHVEFDKLVFLWYDNGDVVLSSTSINN